jgi:hypothetical protein
LQISYKYKFSGNISMISPKWAVLVAAFALVGAITVPTTALAQDDFSQNAEVDIERNNEIEQSIEQSQEACTNEAEVSLSDDDEVQIGDNENEAEVEQSNECVVTQSQTATNTAAIVDDSENSFDVQGFLIGFCPAEFENCSRGGVGQAICANVVSPSLQELCNSVFRG